MNNLKEYKNIKKTASLPILCLIGACLIFGLYDIAIELFQKGIFFIIVSTVLSCKLIFNFVDEDLKFHYQIKDDILIAYKDTELIGEWPIKDTDFDYQRIGGLGDRTYNIVIIYGEDDVDILPCTHVNSLELYNDILIIQGKKPTDGF